MSCVDTDKWRCQGCYREVFTRDADGMWCSNCRPRKATCDCILRLRAEADACQPQPGANMPQPGLVARAHRAAWYRDAARWLEMQDYRDANRASERKEDA